MADPVKRLNYFKGQFLAAADFNDEQAYHVARRRAHNRLLHTWGIADGLGVTFKAGDRRLTIAPGFAIDGLGQEILLPEAAQTAEVSGSAGKTVLVTIAYGEAQTDPPSTDASTGATGDTRWTEAPVVKVGEAPPADRSLDLVLARVTVGADGSVTAVDDGADPYSRRRAGVVGGDLQVTSLTLTDPNRAVAQWTGLRLGGPTRADFAGSLTVAGNLGVGTTSPTQTLTVQHADTAYLNVRDGTREILLGADANGGILSVMSAHDLILRSGSNTERMRVTAAGNVGIGTATPRAKLEVAGAITPAAGGTEASGILFPKDPAGGTGDAAWMRYFARPGGTGEDMTLEIGVSDNTADHIVLNPSGMVGIKRVPEYTLDIGGSVRLGNFTPADQDEWPIVAWIRDSANNWDEGMIKHSSARGMFGRAGFGFHMHESREFGIWSTNWNPLLAVQGGTGNVSMRGGLFFSASDHTHTGIGNTAGRAAIENDSGTFNALMILGRTVSTNPLKRVVALWDPSRSTASSPTRTPTSPSASRSARRSRPARWWCSTPSAGSSSSAADRPTSA